MVIIVKNILIISLITIACLVSLAPTYAETSSQKMALYKFQIPEATLNQYPLVDYKFMDLVREFPKLLPMTLEKFQKIFNNQLRVTKRNEYVIIYTSGPFRTLDGVVITKAEISMYHHINEGKVMDFYIELDQKQCVSTQLLKKEFGFSLLTLLQSNLISNIAEGYYTPDEWGKFRMDDTADYPDCATRINIKPLYSEQEKKEWRDQVCSWEYIPPKGCKKKNDREGK